MEQKTSTEQYSHVFVGDRCDYGRDCPNTATWVHVRVYVNTDNTTTVTRPYCDACKPMGVTIYDAPSGEWYPLGTEENLTMTTEQRTTCRHCNREVVSVDGRWIDPEANGDDRIWRETCDSHDTFQAEHEVTL